VRWNLSVVLICISFIPMPFYTWALDPIPLSPNFSIILHNNLLEIILLIL
jgi:hypothetical protein